jgi:hypothetical protein
METVKVDIQKLQLLNDRIAQTIEALNQVRMSVHGIQHTPVSPWGYGAYPGAQLGFAQQQFSPYASPFVPQLAPPFGGPQFGATPYGSFVGGLSHSPYTTPYTPYGTPFTTPFTTPTQLGGIGGLPVTGIPGQVPWLQGNGISHSSWEPMWQMRGQQAFPFVQYPTTLS